MSDVTASIQDQLSDNAGVAAIVGTRVRRGWADASDAEPYIVITATAGGTQPHHMTAAAGLSNPRVDIHCIASTRVGANALSEAVGEAIDGIRTTFGDDNLDVKMCHMLGPAIQIDEEPEDGSQGFVYRDLLEFELWHAQSVPA